MKRIIALVLLSVSIVFFILGLATIVKGDVNGMQESLFMSVYLIFFAATAFLGKWMARGNEIKA